MQATLNLAKMQCRHDQLVFKHGEADVRSVDLNREINFLIGTLPRMVTCFNIEWLESEDSGFTTPHTLFMHVEDNFDMSLDGDLLLESRLGISYEWE